MIWALALACTGDEPDDSDPTDTPRSTETGLTRVELPPTGATGDTGTFLDPVATVSITQPNELATAAYFDVALVGAASATLDCLSDTDPDERHVLSVVDGENQLHGLLPDMPFHCTLTARDVLVWEGDLVTPALPDPIPELLLAVDGPADLASGYVVMNHWGDEGPNVHRGLIVDGEGRVRWYQAFDDAGTGGLTVTWHPGHLVAGGGRGLVPGLWTLDGIKTFEVGPPPPDMAHHHEARLTAEGYVLGLSGADLPTMPDAVGFLVEVTDPATGEVVYRYDAADGIAAGDWTDLPDDNDPFHPNAVLYLDDLLGPAIWVSLRRTDDIARIDRTTGRMTFRVGGRRGFELLDPSGAPLGTEDWFFGQHAPELYGDRLFVFDNGSGRTDGTKRSRAVEYRVDVVARTVTKVWEWSEPGWYEPYFGSVVLLDSGHVLIGSGHSRDIPETGGNTRRAFVAEVDPATNEVLRRLDFVDARASLFRAQLVGGCELFANVRYCPSLADQATRGGGR